MRHSFVIAILLMSGCNSSLPSSRDSSTALLHGAYGIYGLLPDEDLVLYHDTGSVLVLHPADGTLTTIGTSFFVQIIGDQVLMYPGLPALDSTSSLAVWTEAGGLHTLSSSSSSVFYDVGATTPPWTLYFDNVSSDDTGDLVLSNSDGSGRQTVATQIPTGNNLSGPYCIPYGSTLGDGLLIQFCKSANQAAGTAEAELAWLDPSSGQLTQLFEAAAASTGVFSVDKEHQHGLAIDGVGNGILVDSKGGSTIFASGVLGAKLAPDGDVIYSSSDGIARYSPTGDASVQIQPLPASSKSAFLDDISPDGNTLLISLEAAPSGAGMDLWTTSTAPSGKLSPILNMPTGQLLAPNGVGGSFSRDSGYVFFEGPLDPTTNARPLLVEPAGGGAATVLGNNVATVFITHDARALLCSDVSSSSAINGCELVSVDAANPASPVTLDKSINAYQTYLSADGKTVYYAVNDPIRQGIYARLVP